MRVLVSSLSRDFGGVESLFLNLVSCGYETDLNLDFVCTDLNAAREKDFINHGSKVVHIPRSSKHLIRYIREYFKVFKTGDYDIYHVNLTRFRAPLDIIIAKRFGLKVVLHSHSTQIYDNGNKKTSFIRRMEQIVFRPVTLLCSDLNLACSINSAQYLFKNHAYTILHNGINTEKFCFNINDRNRIRNELGFQRKIVIGHIGRFSLEKNHIYMLEIFKKLLDISKEYRFLCVGDGDLFEYIKEKAKEYNFERYIAFVGQRTDIPSLLSAMDVFILPSIHEALPITMIEAQANGLPCVVSDCITDEIDVLKTVRRLSINEDPQVWAMELSQLNRMGRSIYSSEIFNEFDIIYMKTKLKDIYESLIS